MGQKTYRSLPYHEWHDRGEKTRTLSRVRKVWRAAIKDIPLAKITYDDGWDGIVRTGEREYNVAIEQGSCQPDSLNYISIIHLK